MGSNNSSRHVVEWLRETKKIVRCCEVSRQARLLLEPEAGLALYYRKQVINDQV